jgi:ribonuclease E
MKKTIIIDAAHQEEKRVAVLENGILQDFNREALSIKKLKGNIYLGKIIRVEASLQACFVDYGSQKHGFLPFSDIHPQYYSITDEEKQKLFESYNIENNNEEEDDEFEEDNIVKKDDTAQDSIVTGSFSVEDETENYRGNISAIHKKFNIQDVIKPNQFILVQVTKEERGNKGASMTSYISIAGKYCVLMANTPNKGGVSKKVENFRDRKHLRSIIKELDVPNSRSVIIRTAGVGKKAEEIKRDYEYLEKLWSTIQEVVEKSKSPTFIHAEDDIIRKSIRDIYDENTKEVIIEGEEAYESVLNFAKLSISEPCKNIKLYNDRVPIFNRLRVEQQINELYDKEINLKSGGSIVIDHTEALVAIDVNSGKSTKDSAVEDMALNTNLEAVKEIARQLRLRDLAGLIVIDFIDMSDAKNRRNIERALRDELQEDRARIQLGRISIFGLLEMSRQRLAASFFESITEPCKSCSGTGFVRSVEIVAVSILRAIRHACNDKQANVIYIYTSPQTISYMMNFKRNEIVKTEKNYGIHIFMHCHDEVGVSGFQIKKRKGLSEEESREIEMKIESGQVNRSNFEKDFYKDHSPNNDYQENNNRKNYRRNRYHKKRYKNNQSNDKPKGFVKSLFSVLKK